MKTLAHLCVTGFPLSFDIEIQGLFKDFQKPSNFIFKDQFSTKVYSMSSITAIFNVSPILYTQPCVKCNRFIIYTTLCKCN